MPKKIKWLGTWEDLRDNNDLFQNLCLKDVVKKSKILKTFSDKTPTKIVLWNFIINPRGVLFPVKSNLIGFQNLNYMNWWQKTTQEAFNIFLDKFNEFLPIIPIEKAMSEGLYSNNSLPEQFPGEKNGPGQYIHDYPEGDFEKRQYGGWRWFSPIIDQENWKKEWDLISMPKMDTKALAIHNIAPKYYPAYIYKDGSLKLYKKDTLYYAKPKNVSLINKRFYTPFISSVDKKDSPSLRRYENFSTIIINKLDSKWTLSVWNAFNINYSESKSKKKLKICPEIILSIGRFSDNPDGKKYWGKFAEHLHSYHERIYWIKVGLPEKYQLELNSIIKHQESPIWDGSSYKIRYIIRDPYKRLLNLAIRELSNLFNY
ncbi:MAG: hypothetical protein ACTSRP_26650 [Candidatus Helarchaeota archaeon]